jgi:FtsP/CotA-like multicopper oxidase with cupredoxin domain
VADTLIRYSICRRLILTALLMPASLHLSAQSGQVQGTELPANPETRSPVVLSAVTDPVTGKSAFSFQSHEIPPVIRAAPGTRMDIRFENHMSANSSETCVDGICRNMTNLHFHGLHVSPIAPQDDVITMMAMPGEALRYAVDIPLNQPPGLYWYHTHPHGESYQQSLDGMSGAIVIDGIERYVPEVAAMTERILVLRDLVIEKDVGAQALLSTAGVSPRRCGPVEDQPERIFTVNGALRPRIEIAPGEKQFWRILNASPDLYADLAVDSEQMTVIALDGMPLAFHDPNRKSEKVQHILLAPAGRAEFIVTGPQAGTRPSLRSLCVNTGPDGDPNPEMVIADLVSRDTPLHSGEPARQKATHEQPIHRIASSAQIDKLEKSDPQFSVVFTEDKKGFYINSKRYDPNEGPMTTVTVGQYVHWRVVNQTHEIHPFHIHQVHFLFYSENGAALHRPNWLDTVNVPADGSVDLVMDFTDPIIRGMSLFHCHLLKHEDKGMMAKILFR